MVLKLKSGPETGLDEALSNGSASPCDLGGEPRLTALDGNADASAFRQLADMVFLPGQILQPLERSYVIDMIKTALPAAPHEERVRFAQRLSKMGMSVKALTSVLARDRSFEVAGNILGANAVLGDDDLLGLVETVEPERLKLIASRAEISSAITHGLVKRADMASVAACLSNKKARFSEHTLSICVQLAHGMPDLHKPLLSRREMTSALALNLFWQLNHQGRVSVLTKFLADGQALTRISKTEQVRFDDWRSVAKNQADTQGQAGTKSANAYEQIAAYYSVGDMAGATPVLAGMAGLREAAAAKILSDPGGEPLAVAFKATGARHSDFVDLCERARRSGLSKLSDDVDHEALVILFDRLSRGQARWALTYWNWYAAEIGPYARTTGVNGRDFENTELNTESNSDNRSLPSLCLASGYLSEMD